MMRSLLLAGLQRGTGLFRIIWGPDPSKKLAVNILRQVERLGHTWQVSFWSEAAGSGLLDCKSTLALILQARLMPTLPSDTSTDIVAIFKALSEPIRVEVIELLREQEMCVCDLCDRLGVAQSKLSFHLKTLKGAGLVRSRQEGRWIYYRLHLAQLVELEEYLAEFRRYSSRLPARKCPPEA